MVERGFTLALNQFYLLFFKMGCGPSTNNRAELLAFWALLISSVSMGLPFLFVRGDFL